MTSKLQRSDDASVRRPGDTSNAQTPSRSALSIFIRASTLLWALGSLAACNAVPVESLEQSFTLEVQQKASVGERIKIDFLWVIDNSTSMCEEQVALTRNFSKFTETLQGSVNIDARVAVTTMDMQCDTANPNINSSKGVFSQKAATGFPPSCFAKVISQCEEDSECNTLGDVGQWKCKPHLTSSTCMVNPNGTVNTFCQRQCLSDQECQDKFGDPDYICAKPSGNPDDYGCLLPPPTNGCPAQMPAFLEGDNLDLFECLATVGVNQLKCFKYEQGLNAALDALDVTGPNPDQAKAFLRDDAYLVIIFVSDEDDCSVPSGKGLHEDFYDNCATLGDTDQPDGKLEPVTHFINRFKSFKSDPTKVIVAAIAGDSTSGDASDQVADRELYMESKGHKKDCYHQTYICHSSVGKADWGSRYLELAEGFGLNGIFTNICDEEGIGPALAQIAETIIRVVNKICLPKPVLAADSLVVVKYYSDGTQRLLVEGDDADYKVVPGGDECKIGDTNMPALSFSEQPKPGEKFSITYQGDPALDL